MQQRTKSIERPEPKPRIKGYKTITIDGQPREIPVYESLEDVHAREAASGLRPIAAQDQKSFAGHTPKYQQTENKAETRANPLLLFARKMLEAAKLDAKQTEQGLPTNEALLARYWIEEETTLQQSRQLLKGCEYLTFTWCCHWLELDPAETRKAALKEIDAELAQAYMQFVQPQTSERTKKIIELCKLGIIDDECSNFDVAHILSTPQQLPLMPMW